MTIGPARAPRRDQHPPLHDDAVSEPRHQQQTLDASRKGGGAWAGLEVIEPSTEAIEFEQIPPSILNRFDDLRFLGRGGMGTVYRGWDKQLSREVAIKFVHSRDAAGFLREARAQAQITHENVCKIYDVGFAEGQPYITMQLVRGRPLSAASKDMTLEEKVKVIREAAGALHEAHRMGLVHRDIKPANILVERPDDGQWRPFVMDFGLARMVGEQGETIEGQIAGTPAYMAPEQARGAIRSLDRRTDVYSLGATFYEILADHPPFVEQHPWRMLQRIETEDAPSLRMACPSVPADLETIIMKCLERDPARRYESARALGEDLQRYLDGDPVLARKASLTYRLVKRARKHKLLVSFIAIGIIAATMVVILAIRARKQAADEARIAQEVGEDVKEMQLFMRYAYSLPVHDIDRERAIVRQRLTDIEAKMAVTGSFARGPGHYALGRGHLALQEPEQALEHLQIAYASGYASPELEYALGRAMVEIYREQTEALRRIEDKSKRALRQAEIDAKYKTPALTHLRAAKGSRLERPAYVEGLIALTTGRNEDALRLAKEAQNEAPWFYEAIQLEAEAHYAMGAVFKFDGEFDYEKMMKHFEPTLGAYRRAAEVGSSDPLLHQHFCHAFVQLIYSDVYAGLDGRKHFEEGEKVCTRAVESSPSRGAAYLNRAWLYSAYYGADQIHTTDLGPHMMQAIEMAEEAVRKLPDDPLAHWLAGASWLNYAAHLGYFGFDTQRGNQRAMEEYNAALALDPSFLWPARELSYVYLAHAKRAEFRGEDPFADLERANSALSRSSEIAPGSLPVINLLSCSILATEAQFTLNHGRDPTAVLATHHQICRDALVAAPDARVAKLDASLGYAVHAEFAMARGDDARPFVEKMWEFFGGSTAERKEVDSDLETQIVTTARAKAMALQSPVTEATNALRIVSPTDYAGLLRSSPARLLLIRWLMSEKKMKESTFAEHLGQLEPILHEKQMDPLPFQIAAAIHERHAAWLLEQHRDPSDAIAKGLGMVLEAFKRNPHFAPALATRGDLHLVEAHAAKKPHARENAARLAGESFDAALVQNKYLARETEAARKEVERLRSTNNR